MRRQAFILILTWLVIFSLAGCIGQKPKQPAPTGEGQAGANGRKLTIDDVKRAYGAEEKILSIHRINENYVLAESQRPTFANKFELFNLANGDRDTMPTWPEFVTLEKVESENHIVFLSSGKNSECVFGNFPYLLRCVRVKNDVKSTDDFTAIREDKYFKLDEQVSSGSKGYAQLSDIVVTLNGIQVLFKPVPGHESDFYAAATDIPETKISYDRDKNRMIFHIAETQISSKLKDKTILPAGENQYIASIEVAKDGRSIKLVVGLKDVTEEYIAKSKRLPNQLPYLEVNFRHT